MRISNNNYSDEPLVPAIAVAVAAETMTVLLTSDCRHHSKSDDRPGRQHAERLRTATRRDPHSRISQMTRRK